MTKNIIFPTLIKKPKVLILFVILVMTIFLIAICSACTPQVLPKTEEFTPLTLQLKWVHQAQFAGFYVALEKGFYAEENLDVTLEPGGAGIDIMETVLTGQADFGLVGAEYILLNRSAGKPVKAIATTYRNNPFVLVTMPDSGITSPADFPRHSINVGGIDGYIQFVALLNRLGLDINEMEILSYSYDVERFYSGEVDITPAFSAGSLIEIRAAHPDVNVIWPLDYGIRLYSDTLFTTDSMISENPDLVLRFLRATLKGHQYALDNPEEAVEISLRYAANPDPIAQQQMLEASVPLIYTGQDEIGWMRGEVWQSMYEILVEQNLLEKPVDVEQAYTTRFLEEIYGEVK